LGGQPFFNKRQPTRDLQKADSLRTILQNLDSLKFALCEKKSEVQSDPLQRREKRSLSMTNEHLGVSNGGGKNEAIDFVVSAAGRRVRGRKQ
jgi:hypothetical protein